MEVSYGKRTDGNLHRQNSPNNKCDTLSSMKKDKEIDE
jgi:hypothetical protein